MGTNPVPEKDIQKRMEYVREIEGGAELQPLVGKGHLHQDFRILNPGFSTEGLEFFIYRGAWLIVGYLPLTDGGLCRDNIKHFFLNAYLFLCQHFIVSF